MSDATDSHSTSIRDEFARQADSFARSPTMSMAETLGVLVDLVPEDPDARWVEIACGPGLIARAIAPWVGSVVGLDLTPAMVDKARADADAAGVGNVDFEVGDATALDFADDSFDGAITRFSLHHIPAPVRVLDEMKRVVKPGGHIVLSDFVTDDDAVGAAWQEGIERLRDPSHWALLTPTRIAAMAERIGLEADLDCVVPFEIDYGEWLGRGSGGTANAELIERLLGEKPATAASFNVIGEGEERRLGYRKRPLSLARPIGQPLRARVRGARAR